MEIKMEIKLLWGKSCSMPLSHFWWLAGNTGIPWLVDASSWSVFIFTWHFLCVALCSTSFFLWGHQSHWIKAPLNDLLLTYYLYKYSTSKQGHILRCRGQVRTPKYLFFGGGGGGGKQFNSHQVINPPHCLLRPMQCSHSGFLSDWGTQRKCWSGHSGPLWSAIRS